MEVSTSDGPRLGAKSERRASCRFRRSVLVTFGRSLVGVAGGLLIVEEVESIQLAVFLRTPPALDALKMWEEAVGRLPTGFNTPCPGTHRLKVLFLAVSSP